MSHVGLALLPGRQGVHVLVFFRAVHPGDRVCGEAYGKVVLDVQPREVCHRAPVGAAMANEVGGLRGPVLTRL